MLRPSSPAWNHALPELYQAVAGWVCCLASAS